ncbi:Sgf11 (transcriptional regulation protein), partial [Musa troglodytarum]
PSLLLSEIKTTGPIPLPFIPKDRVLIAAIDQPQAQRSDCALAPSLRAPSLRSLHLPALCLCFFRPLGFSSLAGVFLPPEIALFGLMTPKASDSVTGARGIPLLSWLLLASLLPWRLQLGASIDDEARALLSFKANTEFDPYGALADWEEADEVDSCFWFGVRCDAGRVVALNLKDLCLKGKLAPELGQLIHLKSLILSNNSFYGVIPEELSALQNLEVLDLGHNNLTGPLPTFLSHLLSLRILILTDNGFVGSMSSVLHELNILSEVQFDEDMLSSNKGLITRNLKNATIRRLLQLANHSPAAAAAAAPAPAPASLHNSRHRKRNKNNTNIRTPSAGPSSSSVPPENSHTPFLHPTHAPVVSPSPSASAPSIALPSSPSSHHVPAPAPVIEPPTSVPHNQTKFDLAPSPVSILIPPPIGSPAAAANTHKKHARLWVLSSIASAVSFLLAISAVYLLCWRANKVVTIRPWATGLSGQLQKAFVTGVPALKRSELVAACEDFSNIIGSLSGCMLYKGTLSSGVEIAVISTVVKSAKDWSKQSVTQFRKKVTMLSKLNHKNFVNLLGYCEESEPFSRMMVFEYAPNGTLFEHLHVKEAEHLDWRTRLRIAMGIAYCLEHMHQLNPPIILGSLDSSTVYLTDDYAAKVSDVQFWTGSKDTGSGSGSSSPLSDAESIVHRFGMLLLEILSGRLPFSEEDGLLEQWALCYLNGEKPFKDSIDPTLKSFDEETCDALCKVICCCIQPEAKERPTMAEVTKRMRDITAMPPDGATPKVSPLWHGVVFPAKFPQENSFGALSAPECQSSLRSSSWSLLSPSAVGVESGGGGWSHQQQIRSPRFGHRREPPRGTTPSLSYRFGCRILSVVDRARNFFYWVFLCEISLLVPKMSALNDGSSSPRSQHASRCFEDLLESIVVDVASECHRIARLGLDRNLEDEEEELRLSAQARVADPGSSGESNSKNVVDIFGQTHPAIAGDTFNCMNCGRPVTAGRFAPHLEKCMGKGRKARTKATRSSTIARNRHSRGSPVTVYAPYSNATNSNRIPNGTTAGEEYTDYTFEEP